jgi:hypothetical protein
MSVKASEWQDTLLCLLALAARLEGEGQYNIAKLTRAAADAMSRRAAYQRSVPTDKDELAAGIEQVADAVASLDVDQSLSVALRRGAAALSEGRIPLISETPHPYVCRTCGHLALGAPAENCPTCGAWPGTYQRFMPNYWFDALEPFAALTKLRQTPVEVAVLLQGLPEDVLNQPADDGGWAIRNTVTHFRDAQEVLAYRLDLFLKEDHPILAAKAVWTWATSQDERPPTTWEIFETYKASRAETLAKLEGMPLADWWRTGEHEEFGTVTLRQQVSYFAAHELTHLPQIASLRHS